MAKPPGRGVRAFFKRHEWLTLVSLIGIPLLYLLGFLQWGFFSVYYGLGWLPLTAARYLAAGAVVALFVGVPVAFTALLQKAVDAKWRKKPVDKWRQRAIWHAVLHVLFAVVAGMLVGVLMGAFPVLSTDVWWIWLYFAVGGILVAGIQLYVWGKEGKPELGAKLLGKAPRIVVMETRILAAFIFYVVFAVALFPAMRPAFGGPEPQLATLDIDWNKMSPTTRDRLWPDWNPSDPVARSPQVRVLYQDGDQILLRSTCESERGGALFRIDASVVLSISWGGAGAKLNRDHC